MSKAGELMKKIEANVEKLPFSGCWIWMGAVGPGGYGRVYVGHGKRDRRIVPAHRAAYEAKFGVAVPAGMYACHRCDVPVCVNPDHIFAGTPLDNVRDKMNKGRLRYGVSLGEKHGNSRLTAAQVQAIRRARDGGAKLAEISARFGILEGHATKIINRRLWKHVP